MARDAPLLSSTSPTAIKSASVLIGHIQLRDLIICPRERGVVNYVHHHSIMELNLFKPDSSPQPLVKLSFQPNTLTSLPIDGTDDLLLAAGGQEAEVQLAYCSPVAARQRQGVVWQSECTLTGSINNSVLLTSMSLTRSHESTVEPRLGISNNDSTVKFYNVPVRSAPKRGLDEIGCLRLHVPVNHSSISPDGRTLLSVGDTSKVFLHQMSGGARISFSPIATLKLPSPAVPLPSYISSSLMASFSTSFSADGSKFAVASQEGLIAVWDVRSTRPLKLFDTDKTRQSNETGSDKGNGEASGWVSDEIYDWYGSSFRAPGWSVRNVKFGGAGSKEVMTFTEHTSLLHVVDARTFETEQIVRVPTLRSPYPSSHSSSPESTPQQVPVVPQFQNQQPQHLSQSLRVNRPPLGRSGTEEYRSRVSQLYGLVHLNGNGNGTIPFHNGLPLPIVFPLSNPAHASGSSNSVSTGSLRRRRQRERERESLLQSSSSSASTWTTYSAPDSISDSTWRALRIPGPASGGSGSSSVGNGNDAMTQPFPAVSSSWSSSAVRSAASPRRNGYRRTTGGGGGWSGRQRWDELESELAGLVEREPQGGQAIQDVEEGENDDVNTGSAHGDYEYDMVIPRTRIYRRGRAIVIEPETQAESPSAPQLVRREREDSMEVDADERDIESEDEEEDDTESCTPSRSGSPRPAITDTGTRHGTSRFSLPPSSSVGRTSTPGIAGGSETGDGSEKAMLYVDEVDLAGTCFDPSGRFVYVAATEAVVEWGIRGSEKRWWGGTEWM